jgi:AraC family transcriptional regulator
MRPRFAKIQRVIAYVVGRLEEPISLGSLSAKAGWSPYHLHRAFLAAVGETPKHLTLRLRLARAAVLLLTTGNSVLDVALSCGFQSHEVFCRAFRRRFGRTPSAYRRRGFAQDVNGSQAREHAIIVETVAPCVGLYHGFTRSKEKDDSERKSMTYSIEKRELSPQPVLIVRRRVKRSEIAATIGEALPHVFAYAVQRGIALAGLPFTRYVEMGPGLITMEPGMCVAPGAEIRSDPAASQTSAEPEVVSAMLPGGLVASTIHTGPYDQLPNAYAAIQEWVESHGSTPSGAPWESYLTDPAEHPDPKDWKTEVCWPIAG